MKTKFFTLLNTLKILLLTIMMFMLFIEHNVIKWMVMEFFTLIFIGFFMNYSSKNKISSLIYFYMSSIISLLLMWTLLIYYNNWYWELWMNIDPEKFIMKKIIQSLFLMKLGMYPFQFWMPQLFMLMNWNVIFLFTTINKLMPMFMLTTLSAFKDPVFMYLIMLNSIISVTSAINEENYKKIMAYSSINHSTFMVLLSYLNTHLWIIYFFLYTLNSYIFIKLMDKMNVKTKSNLLMNYHSKLMNFLFVTFTLSYSMLPPFMFFIIKWFFFYETNLSNSTNFFLCVIMMSSVIMTYNYLDMMKFSIFHKKLAKKHILLNKFYIKNKNMCKILMFLFNLFIFCIFFY